LKNQKAFLFVHALAVQQRSSAFYAMALKSMVCGVFAPVNPWFLFWRNWSASF